MKNLHRKVDLFSNVAIILIAFLLGGVVIYRYVLNDSPPQLAAAERKTIKVGTKLDLPDANWDRSGKTLVMAISTNCHFCSESIPFYKKLVEKKADIENIRLIVVAPQSAKEVKPYLDENKLFINEIRQSPLNKIQANGTPTLILVDQKGAVIESWVGKLPPEKEAEVIKRLFG